MGPWLSIMTPPPLKPTYYLCMLKMDRTYSNGGVQRGLAILPYVDLEGVWRFDTSRWSGYGVSYGEIIEVIAYAYLPEITAEFSSDLLPTVH